MIAILDYGMGNLRSVEKALIRIGAGADRTADHERVCAAAGIVLPGVGAFPEAMSRIRSLGLDEVVHERVGQGVPLLGVCLGMQLLFSESEELGGDSGLGLIEGRVRALDAPRLKVPHMGWSPVSWRRRETLNQNLQDPEPFYFVHTFIADAAAEDVVGTALHGEEFAAVVARGNVWGAQFHPEKSSAAGLELLRSFAVSCGEPVADGAAPA